MNNDALEQLKKRRKKKRLLDEAERDIRPIKWRPKGRQ
jgi:hypothetical protein